MDKELLAPLRNYLDITWEDAGGDQKLLGILARGKTYLEGRSGGTLSFDEGTRARELLFEYARYARANVLADFARDYATLLNELRAEGEVSRFDQEHPELL